MLTNLGSEHRTLYRWQLDALVSWLRCGRRGVIEAVTGSGKTDVAIAAAADALRRGRFVLVVVPSRVLMEQWHGRLRRRAARQPDRSAGRQRQGPPGVVRRARRDPPLGGGVQAGAARRVPAACSSPTSATASAAGRCAAPCCRQYDERLGLTATLERSDDAVTELLLPYFGGICYRYGFEQAIADGVCAPPRVAFVGVALSVDERAEYIATEQQLVSARQHLRSVRGHAARAVRRLPRRGRASRRARRGRRRSRGARVSRRVLEAAPDRGPAQRQVRAARPPCAARSRTPTARWCSPRRCAPRTTRSTGSIRCVSIDLITGSTARRQRRDILDDLRVRKLDAVAAPRVLDEGIDVPDANLGIVMSASRTRRQMIQRMGRILRRKRPGVAARFVIMFAKDTLEDPANRIERDGFLDEIERISEATGVFDSAPVRGARRRSSPQPGPSVVPEPERLERYERAVGGSWRDDGQGLDSMRRSKLADAMRRRSGLRVLELRPARALGPAARGRRSRLLDARLPRPEPTRRISRSSSPSCPTIAKPKVEAKRLSTGHAPLEIARIGSAWRISCTGCGEASPPVQFRWQVLDQTVACRCE